MEFFPEIFLEDLVYKYDIFLLDLDGVIVCYQTCYYYSGTVKKSSKDPLKQLNIFMRKGRKSSSFPMAVLTLNANM